MSKVANAQGFLGRILGGARDAIRSPWAPIVAPAVFSGGSMAVKRIMDARNRSKTYKEMLELNPHLRSQNAQDVKRVFNSLRTVNDHMMKDPMLAGAYVSNAFRATGDMYGDSRDTYEGARSVAETLAGLRRSFPSPTPGIGARDVGSTIDRFARNMDANEQTTERKRHTARMLLAVGNPDFADDDLMDLMSQKYEKEAPDMLLKERQKSRELAKKLERRGSPGSTVIGHKP